MSAVGSFSAYPFCWANCKALSKSIYERIGWKQDFNFKFRGITRIRGNAKILIFYLDEPQIIPSKKTKQSTANEKTNNTEQYIAYKENTENESSTNVPETTTVSKTITNNDSFGISLSLSKKRDWIVHSISEQDIQTKGVFVDNPLIGALPSKYEINEELEKLIASM